MGAARKFTVPHLPPIVVWGTVTALLSLGVLVTLLDLSNVSKAEAARATKQKQRFSIDAVSGDVALGEANPAPVATPPEVKPAEVPAPPPEDVKPAEEKPTEAPAPEAAAEKPAAEAAPAPAPEAKPAEVHAEAKPAETKPETAPAEAKPEAAPEPAAPSAEATPAEVKPAEAAPAEKPAPVASAPTHTETTLPANTPALRTTPLSEALQDQPRTKDSLVMAPAPEITETVDGLKVPKRGDKDVTAAKLYAHPFKREADQVLISFVILNTGLDPQSIGLAMALPPEVTVAYSPYTKPGMAYSENLRTVGHEVWTMLPAMGEHYPSDDPGPMGIISKMPPEEIARRVRMVLAAIPGSVGLVLPPDETVIPQKDTMAAALSEISTRGVLLMATNPNHSIDQITTNSKAGDIIRRADLILDPTPNESLIRSRLAGLLDTATEKGELVVVLSSRPQSLQILSDWLEQAKLDAPFALAPLSAIYKPKEAPTVAAPEASGGHGSAKKAKPAAKKPKPLPQDQYKQPAKPAGGH